MHEVQIYILRRRKLFARLALVLTVATLGLLALVPLPAPDRSADAAFLAFAETPISSKTTRLLLAPYPVSSEAFVSHVARMAG